MKKTTKSILVSCAVMLSISSFTACNNTQESLVSTQAETKTINTVSEINNVAVNESNQTTPVKTESKSDETDNMENGNPQYASLDKKMPAPFLTGIDMGGDENADFYQPCNRVLDNIPVELMNLRSETEVSNWINSFPPISVAPSSITEYANIYSFITYFNISKEEAETTLSVYLNSNDEQIKITREEFDIIFSGDIAAVTNTFASDYSIAIGKSVYCPNWIYTHSTDDYVVAGITADVVAEKVSAYSNFNLTENACAAFSDKLSAFTGETISIEPVQVYTDFHYNDFAYDVANDEMEDVDEDEVIIDEVVAEIE